MKELGTSASVEIVSVRPIEGDPKGFIVTFNYKYPKVEFKPFSGAVSIGVLGLIKQEQAQGILQFTKAKTSKK